MSAPRTSEPRETAPDRAGSTPPGVVRLRPGADPIALLGVVSAQLDAIGAALATLAQCFVIAAPPSSAPPAPREKQKPRTFGDASARRAREAAATPDAPPPNPSFPAPSAPPRS